MYKFDDVRIENRRIEDQFAERMTARLTAEATACFEPTAANANMRGFVESDLRERLHHILYGDMQERLMRLKMMVGTGRYSRDRILSELQDAAKSIHPPKDPRIIEECTVESFDRIL